MADDEESGFGEFEAPPLGSENDNQTQQTQESIEIDQELFGDNTQQLGITDSFTVDDPSLVLTFPDMPSFSEGSQDNQGSNFTGNETQNQDQTQTQTQTQHLNETKNFTQNQSQIETQSFDDDLTVNAVPNQNTTSIPMQHFNPFSSSESLSQSSETSQTTSKKVQFNPNIQVKNIQPRPNTNTNKPRKRKQKYDEDQSTFDLIFDSDFHSFHAQRLCTKLKLTFACLLIVYVVLHLLGTTSYDQFSPIGPDIFLLLLGWYSQDMSRLQGLKLYYQLTAISICLDAAKMLSSIYYFSGGGENWILGVTITIFLIEGLFKVATIIHARNLRNHLRTLSPIEEQ